MRWWQVTIGIGVIIFSAIIFAGITVASGTLFANMDVIASKDRLVKNNDTGLILLDNEGREFFSFYNVKDRSYIPLDGISENVLESLIVAEDKDFYDHDGFSIKGMVRSLLLNIEKSSLSYGGSTITQQLVKNTILTPDKNLMRKYQELVLARAIEEKYTKEEILEMYLNTAYFGEGAYGIENAAKTYFNKSASDLSVAESSFVISLLPSPSATSPYSGNPEIAYLRQEMVIKALFEGGHITAEEYDEAVSYELVFEEAPQELNNFAVHYALAVRDFLIEKYGENVLMNSGLTVKTALSRSHQKEADRELAANAQRLADNGGSNGAVVVMEPVSGDVLALSGSVDWDNERYGKLNMALAPRQPGSSFKPIVYALALEEERINPATMLTDRPITYKIKDCVENCEYKPKNYDSKFRGPVTVRRALSNSLNVPAVEVMEKVGVGSVLGKAKELGIESLGDNTSDYGLSLVLGAGNVPLLDMTNAYAAFANKGEFVDARLVTEIVDKEGRKEEIESESERVWSEEIAFMISSILSDNNARREAFGNILDISRPAAVKTGTTDDYRDAWTIGYTPDLVVGVWVGNNDNSSMNSFAGSMGAAPIWRNLMEVYHEGLAVREFELPENLVMVADCFVRARGASRAAVLRNEFFIKGSENRCLDTLPRDVARNDRKEENEELASENASPTEGIDVPEGVGGPPEFLQSEVNTEENTREEND